MDAIALREAIRALGRRLGFSQVGFASASPAAHHEAFRDWLAAGHAGEMSYLARQVTERAAPTELLPGARSVIVVMATYGAAPSAASPAIGRVACYASGRDYHVVLRTRLRALAAALNGLAGREVATRVAVDTAPLAERATAARAGLGFIGKNTQLITPGVGSYTVLGALIVDLALPPDEHEPAAVTQQRCGRCDRCLRACPTAAFVAPYQLDARRCISYLTIELRSAIPRELRAAVGSWVFGCDLCQAGCPFNHRAPAVGDPALGPADSAALPLVMLLGLRASDYRRVVRGRALRRVNREQLQRNAAVALGNSGDRAFVPPLTVALQAASPLVRGHAAWALGRLGGTAARAALAAAYVREADAAVREEITAALA